MNRFWKLAGTTTRAATKLTGHRVKKALGGDPDPAEVYAIIGEELAKTLGELKGPVMKLGQAAAQMHDLLPPQVAEALKPLQRAAPPADWAVIEQQITAELGQPPSDIFASIDTTPMAAASIGQVHAATLPSGQRVAVKVQYPGVDAALDGDLRSLRRMLKLGRLANVPGETLDAVFEEMRARLSEELDYTLEARNVADFSAIYADDSKVLIPAVCAAQSSRRVLTLEYAPGDSLEQAAQYPADIRTALSHRLFDLIGDQIFTHRALHADPHPGNFAFKPDGTIIVYDFGSIKRLSADTVDAYRTALCAGLQADYPALDAALQRVGLRRSNTGPPPSSYYADWRAALVEPLGLNGAVDFSATQSHKQVAALSRQSLRHIGRFQPAPEQIMIDRVVGGHYWNLVTLGATVSFKESVHRLLQIEAAV